MVTIIIIIEGCMWQDQANDEQVRSLSWSESD